MKIGINSFTWVSPFSTQHVGLLRKAKNIGYDIFEMATEEPDRIDIKVVKSVAEENDIDIVVCGVFGGDRDLSSPEKAIRENAKRYLRWVIDAAQYLGSPCVSGPMYSVVGKRRILPQIERHAEYERSVESVREMAAYAGDHGVLLGIEPINRFEIDMINTVDQGLKYIEDVGSPYVGLQLDTFHMHIEEKDTEAALVKAGKHLIHLHTCENDRGIPGTGQVDWVGVHNALKQIAYKGAGVIESFTPDLVAIADAVCLWRPIVPSQDILAVEGLNFLRKTFVDI
jgi:D-psicose/D-tagatose/L-ribulose 3-epimerase